MITTLIFIISILITIFFVVGTHEYAHFIVARLLKIKVLRFSIGFGKTLFHWYDKSGTEYVFALIPLGGYVKMLDETEGPVAKEELGRAFNRQPLYKKFLIVIAGPLMNILCAFFLYWIIFMIGFDSIKPVIGTVITSSIADASQLKANQEITHIDGSETSTWQAVLLRLLTHIGNEDSVQIETRDLKTHLSERHTLSLTHWHLNELTPDPLESIGIRPYEPNIPLIIGIIAANSPAASGALQLGDKILSVNHIKINNWHELIRTIYENPNKTLSFSLERQKKLITISVAIGEQRNLFFKKSGYLGIGPTYEVPTFLLNHIQYGPFFAAKEAFLQLYDFTYLNILLFAKLVSGKLSLQSLGGPITIFESAGTALQYGLLSFLGFLAFLSISIGIINFLPIPGLDGGHLLFYLIEAIRQKPLPERVVLLLYRLGLIAIFLLLVQALVNDLLRVSSAT